MDELPVEPIESVEVAALLVTCGVCGAVAMIEYEALDSETGRIDVAEAFVECADCGCIMDTTAASFSALIAPQEPDVADWGS